MTTVAQAHAERRNGQQEYASAALAIRDGQDFWDAKQIAALAQLGIKDASNADLAIYMHYCQKTGLDPFSRQIYMLGRRSKVDGEWVTRQTIQIGIDGYRVIATRAARRDGVTLSYSATSWYDAEGLPHPVWVRPEPPAAATVTVYRDGQAFPGVARFLSFAAFSKEGQLMGQWAVMPDHMIAKCAEAQALRRAFPHDLGGTHTDDELAHTEQPPPRPRRPQRTLPRDVVDAVVVEEPVAGDDTRQSESASGPDQGGRSRGNQGAPPSPPQDRPRRPSKADFAELDRLLRQIPLGPPEDVQAFLNWRGKHDGGTGQARKIAAYLRKHLEDAEGNTDLAAEAIREDWQADLAMGAQDDAEGTQDTSGTEGGGGG